MNKKTILVLLAFTAIASPSFAKGHGKGKGKPGPHPIHQSVAHIGPKN